MGASKVNQNKKADGGYQGRLVGTWVSVGVVGAVILFTYIVLFGLFMSRF
ncbi:cytochrome c oxidase subunit 2A [Bacillus sp. HNG]|nr:cytochrome c oxidase subunit 2A [Bacillus sp. HNG]RFB09961.1 cytochrome c oxidase subunit 2A [Bacillus sp. HNG]